MRTLVCFGECMVELRKDPKGQVHQGFAGDAFNTCVYFKRLFSSLNVEFATQIGTDPLSDDMLAVFDSEQIGQTYVTRSHHKVPGLYWITTDDEGERTFTYWRDDSAARYHMESIDEGLMTQILNADYVFLSGISLAVIKPSLRENFWHLIEKAKASGGQVIFDPNYRPRLWLSEQEVKTQYQRAFEYSDIVLPGIEDLTELYGLQDVDSVIEFFKPFALNELVIKNGPETVVTVHKDEVTEIAIEPVKHVVDTTSAGDSFNGAYLGARMSNLSVQHSVELAAKVAGFVIQHPGAIIDAQTFSKFKALLEVFE